MCKDVSLQCCVLVLLCERRFVSGTLLGVSHHSLDLFGDLRELGLACYLLSGERFGSRVADLRGEACAVHLFEDDLGVLADFAPKGLEGGFEFDF